MNYHRAGRFQKRGLVGWPRDVATDAGASTVPGLLRGLYFIDPHGLEKIAARNSGRCVSISSSVTFTWANSSHSLAPDYMPHGDRGGGGISGIGHGGGVCLRRESGQASG